jgi:predicted TIM-barrel fold metal-dependent hydrolase
MPHDTTAPAVKGPPLSCDCHLHVFGDPATYPYSPDKRNVPPVLPLADYMAGYQDLAKRCGIERMVFTQPSTYGRDNTCLLDAIKLCNGNARGIVDIDENAPDAELARLSSAGVVGIRFNLGPPNRPREAGLMEKHLARLQRLDRRYARCLPQIQIEFHASAFRHVLGARRRAAAGLVEDDRFFAQRPRALLYEADRAVPHGDRTDLRGFHGDCTSADRRRA